MDIIKCLETLKKLEIKMQDLYEFYHKYFAADIEIAGRFFELSLEEKSHADLIDYQLRTIKKNRSMFNDVDFDIEPLNQFVANLEAHILSKEPISLADALKFGIELENDAVECHFRTLIQKSNPELGELVKKLGAYDKEHIDKLRTLAKRKGCLDK